MKNRSRQHAAGSGQSYIALPAARCALRAGFSFTEIMFAVIILGIGFIMVAAIFPVALQQSKTSTEEIAAAPIARGGVNYIQSIASLNPNPLTNTNLPATNGLVAQVPTSPVGSNPSFWDSLRGNLILPEDPRYGWIFLYRRDGTPAAPKPYIYAYVFPVQARATPTFTQADVPSLVSFNENNGPGANLMAHMLSVVVIDSDSDPALVGQPDFLAIDLTATVPPQLIANANAAVEGAYVVIADDKLVDSPTGTKGRMNGHIYRLGARRADMDGAGVFGLSSSVVYELQPGNDFNRDGGANGMVWSAISNASDTDDIVAIGNTTAIPGSNSSVVSSNSAIAYIIGKGYTDPANPNSGYSDTAMPIGAYVTFIK